MRKIILATVTAVVMATPALAQDYEEKPFEGFYVGINGGGDYQANDVGSAIVFDRDLDGEFGDPVLTAANADAFSTGYCNGRAQGATREANGGCEPDRNRGSYYGRIGYDRQFGNIVVGGLAEFGDTNIVDYVTAFSTTPASYTFARTIDWEGSLRGRVGYAANTTLFYATGGAGYARLARSFTTTNTANSFTPLESDDEKLGFIVGGGLEQKITRNISFGLEYSYHDYVDRDYVVRVGQGSAPATNPFVLAPNTTGTDMARPDVNFRWHSVRAAVNFRF